VAPDAVLWACAVVIIFLAAALIVHFRTQRDIEESKARIEQAIAERAAAMTTLGSLAVVDDSLDAVLDSLVEGHYPYIGLKNASAPWPDDYCGAAMCLIYLFVSGPWWDDPFFDGEYADTLLTRIDIDSLTTELTIIEARGDTYVVDIDPPLRLEVRTRLLGGGRIVD